MVAQNEDRYIMEEMNWRKSQQEPVHITTEQGENGVQF